MSKYTTEVRYICEHYAGKQSSGGFDEIDQILDRSWDKIITTNATLFDTSYKPILCKKLLKHYYLREIGMETVGVWKLMLNRRFEELLPYYNKLWESELLEFNPLYDVDLNTTSKRQRDDVTKDTKTGTTAETEETKRTETLGETVSDSDNITTNRSGEETTAEARNGSETTTGERETSDSKTTNSSRTTAEEMARTLNVTGTENVSENTMDLFSDTPQGGVTGLVDGNYLTNARKVDTGRETTNRTDSTESSTTNGTETGTGTEIGTGKVSDSGSKTSSGTTDGSKDWEENGTEARTGSEERNRTTNDTGNRSRDVNQTETADGTLNSLEDYAERVIGKRGGQSYSALLQEFRDTFLNIDMMFIEEFSDLFFGLW